MNSDRKGLLLALGVVALAGGTVYALHAVPEGRRELNAAVRGTGCDDETVARYAPVVRWHSARFPEIQVEDLYKLLHQAVAGPAHSIEDPEMAREWLEREWNGLGDPLPGEELFEPLSADGRLVRVNLRPWRAAGRSADEVLGAFLHTAEAVSSDTSAIRFELDAIGACGDRLSGGLRVAGPEVQSFFYERANQGYPAVHHSKKYEAEYHPAYRVVLRGLLD
ncbi:MAG: hypothetical protein ACWGON_08930 [Gemmatimonadota bacterium]